MVFGIALEKLLRWHPAVGIPALLLKCVLAIEARGLDKEGIYRVSGKHSDVNDLKQRLEVDVYSINLEDDKWDVHVIAGLVKMYLRQLPTPVFEFPAKERSEYAQITDEKERVLRLRQRVKALPRSHHTVLRFLVDHLTKVTAHSAYNKMTVPNIALIFAPVVFQGQPELPTEGGNQSTSLAAQFFGKGQHGGDASKGLSDMSQYDIFKSDGVRSFLYSSKVARLFN
ncbi:Rho GTPase activation protein [Phlyctochytrium arcticum]|nr:Rho GTPase activation protein [Phlyctochytrium arcticum]